MSAEIETDAVLPELPFVRHRDGGRALLGTPPRGDGSSRRGYGVPAFAACGTCCSYCGRELGKRYEDWLDLSIDHVIPTDTVKTLGYPREWLQT